MNHRCTQMNTDREYEVSVFSLPWWHGRLGRVRFPAGNTGKTRVPPENSLYAFCLLTPVS